MNITQLSFSKKMYWLEKYRDDYIKKIQASNMDNSQKENEIREMRTYFNNAINKLDHMKHDKAYWSGIHGCIKAQMKKEGKYRMELQTFNNAQFGVLRTTEIEGKIYYCGNDIAKALGYAKPNNAINQHCKGALKQGTPTSGGVQELVFIPEGDVYRLTAHSKLPQAEKFESWVFDEVLPQIAHTGTYEVPNKSDPMQALELMFAAEKETRSMVHEVNNDLQNFKKDIPLLPVECDDVQKAVRQLGTKILGGHGTPAYCDDSLRGRVYADIGREIKHKFGVRSYKAIKRKYLDDVNEIIEKYTCPKDILEDIVAVNKVTS